MGDARWLLGVAGWLIALGACASTEPAPAPSALPGLTDGAECVAQADGVQQVFRWRADPRRLEQITPAATMSGTKLSTFVHLLDEQDRLMSKEQVVEGASQWRHVYTRDEQGNPLSFRYESQERLVSQQSYVNSYEGGRLVTVEQTSDGSAEVITRYSYSYDQQGRRSYERIDFLHGSPRPPEEVWSSYDDDGRLASVRRIHLHGEDGLTTYAHDGAGRLVEAVTDGGPYVGDRDGRVDVTVSWSYGPRGRISAVITQGALSDIGTERGGRFEKSFGPGCERFQTRFPGMFRLPAELTFNPP